MALEFEKLRNMESHRRYVIISVLIVVSYSLIAINIFFNSKILDYSYMSLLLSFSAIHGIILLIIEIKFYKEMNRLRKRLKG